ncbi:MAG: Crp/Fnr family transcriptional regulator [Spirochaetes bacterium]|nr:Crp/Fnr family transcriptional regulator [Spirochaetota bacterium]
MENVFNHTDLKKYKFFSLMPDRLLETVMQSSNIMVYRKERAVFYQDDLSSIAYFILSGEIKKVKYRSDMTSIILGRLSSGSWAGLPEVIAGGPYLNDAVTVDEVKLLAVPQTGLRNLMKYAEMQLQIINELSHGYYSVHAYLDVHTSLQKIVNFLCSRINSLTEGENEIYVTQEYIAEAVGVTRETVNKYLKFMEQKGLISINRSCIQFTDKASFQNVSAEFI